MNTPAISARSLLQSRLLLDHRGQYQCLLRMLQGQTLRAALPGGGQRTLHGLVREAENGSIGRVGGEAVGIGEEAPFRALPCVAQGGHHLGCALALQRVGNGRVRAQRREEFCKRRALDHGQLLEHDFAFGEQGEDLLRAGVRGYLVHASLHAHLPVRQPQPPGHRPRIGNAALRLQVIQDRAQARARNHLDAHHLPLRSRRGVVLRKPVIAEGGGPCAQQQQDQQACQQPATALARTAHGAPGAK